MRHLFILFISFFILQRASAFDIDVDADDYVGWYAVDAGSAKVGNHTFSLSAGAHTLSIFVGGTVGFTVNSDGTVTSGNLDVLSHSGSTLTFNNVDVDFNVGQFNQVYMIGLSSFKFGSATYRLPVGIDLSITVPPSETVSTFTVSPTTGDVTILSNTDALEGGQNEISFNTVEIDFDTQLFNGTYTFNGRPFLAGNTTHYLFPNTDFQIIGVSGTALGTISTTTTGLVSSSTSPIKTEGSTVNFYHSRYIVTPPSGTVPWQFLWGYPQVTGTHSVWLLRGAPGQVYVNGSVYSFTATSDCTSFTISTTDGIFNLDCDNASALYADPLTEQGFNDIDFGFILKRYDGRLSTDINDYELTVNGQSYDLSGANLTLDTLHDADAFEQGRNVIVLDGEDEDGNPFQISKTYWAGDAEVTVGTHGATDTVTLTVEQTIEGTKYIKSVDQEAVANQTIFNNVPQIENGVVYVSTSRGKKTFIDALPRESKISL